ncbi:MAG: hypothetical protein IPP93_12520 [Chitinophagaceae bacterium]|nr:hypothetical protein [Chitinophagaceae bacterium]
MKKLLTTLTAFILFAAMADAQAPAFFNYQGVARNSVGNALVNQPITLRLSIHDGSATGPVVYAETRALTTNAFGLFNVQVGGAGATLVSGSIAATDWYLGTKWMQVEIDPAGGKDFKDIGTTQLTSVPYSLFTKQSGDIVLPFSKTQNDAGPLFRVSNGANSANALAIEGSSSSTAANAGAVRGIITPTSPGGFSAGVIGQNNGTGGNGIGVYGVQNGNGWGVYGTTPGGLGVKGASASGTGVYGESQTGAGVTGASTSGAGVTGTSNSSNSASFFNTNSANAAATVSVNTNGSGDGIAVTNTGNAKSGFFQNTNAANNSATFVTATNGAGDGLQSLMTGTGNAGVFNISNAANQKAAIDVSTNGIGRVANLTNTNAANASSVLEILTNGTGRIAWMRNTNAANPSNIFDVSSNGTGRLAILQNLNAANNANMLEMQTNGLGKGLFLQNTNAANNANVMELQTNGTGRGLLLQNTNAASSANIAEMLNNGTGRSLFIQSTNAASAANPFEVVSAGTGYTALIRNTNASAKALRTVGALQFTGIGEANNKLMATDATGNATWQFPAAIGVATGTGTNNYVTKWTPGSTNIGVSQIFDDGTKIAFAGGIDPFYKVNVNGTFKVNASATDTAVAIFENTSSSSKGDGIIIKIGRTHPRWNGSAYANVPNVFTTGVQTQMDQIRDWVYGNDTFSWDDIINLMPSQWVAGTVCNLTNLITEKINTSLSLPLKIGPYSTPTLPIWDKTTIFGGLDLGPLGSIPKLEIPALTIPAMNVLPEVTVMPQLPQISCAGLPSVSWPVFVFDDVNNTLSKENEFVSFVDKDNRKLGAVRAQSIQNFSYDYFDGQKMLDIAAEIIGIDIVDDFMSILSGLSEMVNDYNNIGVEYSSGNGDYAEWLERSNPKEDISYGDIVAVKGGKITKDLAGAEQIMAVSKQPIVLGNVPEQSKVKGGNNIAFMGQIPVKVTGPVRAGDYIVARNDVPGYGMAIHPADMKVEDYKLAVGRSWDTNEKAGPKMVNTVVGVHNHDFLNIIAGLQQKAQQTDDRLKAIENMLQTNGAVKEQPKKAFR